MSRRNHGSDANKTVLGKLPGLFRDAIELVRLPRIRISLGDDPIGHRLYKLFTAPHRRIPCLKEKEWGVALQPMPLSFADFARGGKKQALRTNAKRCEALGYTGRVIEPIRHVDAILAIYRSSEVRQKSPVQVEMPQLVQFCQQPQTHFLGLFDAQGDLRAYTGIEITGELAYFHTFIGHADALERGVMYGLMTAAMRFLSELPRGSAKYAMYDSYYGHGPGLRYFMRRCGFEPFNVTWRAAVPEKVSRQSRMRPAGNLING
jgi:hypothetical protein